MPDTDAPRLIAADHVSFTVADLDAAVAFYADAFGATELFRMGPLVGAEIPPLADGRDWMGAHVGVEGATLTLAMLKLADNLNLQLVQYDAPAGRGTTHPRVCDIGGHHLALRVDDVDKARAWLAAKGCTVMEIIEIPAGPLAGKKNLYCRDPFGNPLEIVD
ncbi:VOC family protein [Sphingomonas nostoxanthinifaciens]|uniref:VOC family protein n=1 Tax=Sphingomonas nostoxanthinifaciens TaxID=2872652 RepID=UPI001CC1FE0E|nr:VOC family protein [Sphingomonas nostoxanthinifaciens]UAK22910.1 VOC family protein [Sphingomonas nostoxanthinifaciens]